MNKAAIQSVRIAYIGGGSRGWAWKLMSDLAKDGEIEGEVDLYDIDFEAAKANETIGNRFSSLPDAKSSWKYTARREIGEALTNADFVVISILPGTFDEMQSDVHTPERYGIYQPVGDTTGPGGIIRALRTVPMMEAIAEAIKRFCPDAWVINYTNPMALSVKALYDTFPNIKAFGCCHEVFGTQKIIADAIYEKYGIEVSDRSEVKVNVVGVNHFTWITEARYKSFDAFAAYAEYANRHYRDGIAPKDPGSVFTSYERVKFDLFRRYGVIAAAGDRHLAEFCPGSWYLGSPENVSSWGFCLTPVSWRKKDLEARLARSRALVCGDEDVRIKESGEDGVRQIKALLGISDFVSNVNLPNRGQIPNLPLGAIVETNAAFRSNTVTPLFAGDVPIGVWSLVSKSVGSQLTVARAAKERNPELAFRVFAADPLVTIGVDKAKELFKEMVENTKEYLKGYKWC